MQQSSILAALIAGLMLAACGCADTAARPASPPAGAAVQPAATTLTIENILQWPLEGDEGFAKLHDNLSGLAGMTDISSVYRISEHYFMTSDGYLVENINIRKKMPHISIGLALQPCYRVENAKTLPNLARSTSGEDMHGNFVGYTYYATGNGISIHLTTAPSAPDCIVSINIFGGYEK